MEARYMSGFGNSFETEALPDALPIGRNSPQKCNYGLYAEQLSGSPFTAPQATNQRSWLYRIRPAVKHSGRYRKVDKRHLRTAPCREDTDTPIGQMRWSPVPIPDEKISFVEGLCTVTTAGDADTQVGMAAHLPLRHPGHAGRVFLQRRWRIADRGAGKTACASVRSSA